MDIAATNSFNSDIKTQRPPFEGVDELFAQNVLLSETNNISANSGVDHPVVDSLIDPFAGDISGQLNGLIFDRLKSLQDEKVFDGVENVFPGGDSSSLNQDSPPVGNGNRNFGSDNATIGNSNSDFGSDSATIGNGNWNFNNDNATIGNGNWLFAGNNTTLGNGNWNWDEASNNSTLGNGNWQFNSDNATIGNGNWGFGNNNTTLGNGNWNFGKNNTIIGNGNWIFDDNNIIIGDYKIPKDAELIPPGFQTDVDNLINSLIGGMGEKFLPLTGSLGVSETETFNQLILSQYNGHTSTDIQEFLALFKEIQTNAIAYQNSQKPQPVPESAPSISLLLVGIIYLLWSKFKPGFIRPAK
ncbi:MAG TPA: hypothetical protein VE956_22105 [Nodularia sp. (in: cyanobacteria)]|nr:hypothetical protein [Nodularia sp. (in: cyanobacteria)]